MLILSLQYATTDSAAKAVIASAISAVSRSSHMGALFIHAGWQTSANRPAGGQQTKQQELPGFACHGN